MIKRETFEEPHIKELQQMNRRDPQLVEIEERADYYKQPLHPS